MRNLLALLLVGLITACPFLCEGAELVEGLHRCQAETSCEHPAQNPAPCTDDSGSCICSGAIQAADVRLPDSHAVALPLPVFLTLPALGLRPSAFHHLTCDGGPTGLASFGDSGTVRAILQNYRC